MTASFEPWLFAPPFAVYEGLETNGQTTSGDLKATSRRKRLWKMSILLVYHNSQAIIQPIFKTIARPPKRKYVIWSYLLPWIISDGSNPILNFKLGRLNSEHPKLWTIELGSTLYNEYNRQLPMHNDVVKYLQANISWV